MVGCTANISMDITYSAHNSEDLPTQALVMDDENQTSDSDSLLKFINQMIDNDLKACISEVLENSITEFSKWNPNEHHADELVPDLNLAICDEAHRKALQLLQNNKYTIVDWLVERLHDQMIPYLNTHTRHVDAICNFGFDRLISADSSQIALQANFQLAAENAIDVFNQMLGTMGVKSNTAISGQPYIQRLFRSNPMNVMKLLTPIAIKASNGDREIEWVLYRILGIQLFSTIIVHYQKWASRLTHCKRLSNAKAALESVVHHQN